MSQYKEPSNTVYLILALTTTNAVGNVVSEVSLRSLSTGYLYSFCSLVQLSHSKICPCCNGQNPIKVKLWHLLGAQLQLSGLYLSTCYVDLLKKLLQSMYHAGQKRYWQQHTTQRLAQERQGSA
eukprot:589712-Amphidinium_carterae.1